MRPIGTSGVVLTCNTGLIGVTFRSILESTIEASEAASIGDTRQKELFYLQTNFTFIKRRFFFKNLLLYPESYLFLIRLRSVNKEKKNQIAPSL